MSRIRFQCPDFHEAYEAEDVYGVERRCKTCRARMMKVVIGPQGPFRPVVMDMVAGMAHQRSNIAAVHFDGPVLGDMLACKQMDYGPLGDRFPK